MVELKIRKKGYLPKLFSSLRNLWSAQEMLAPRNIRKGYLQYLFAFPLSMVFINIQDFVVDDGIGVFGLAHTTITFLGFALGAIVMFTFSNERNIAVIAKTSALIAAVGFLSWLFLPDGNLSLVCDVFFMAGVGGCVSSSSFFFVFMLNNAERFFGSTLMLLLIDLVELSAENISIPSIVQKLFVLVMVAALCACMYLSKSKDYHETEHKALKKFDPSIWLVLFIFFSYFAIRITGFYAPSFQNPPNALFWGMLAFVMILCLIILQVVSKRSIWTMCNVFFIASILGHLMWYLKLPEASYLFSELKEVGFLIAFYLIGCVTNKFCNFRMHKRLVLLCMAIIGILYVSIDVLHMVMPTQTIAVITAAVLFVAFLLLSPAFSQHLFFANWSKEFRQVNMSSFAQGTLETTAAERNQMPSLDDTNLSPREKQVALLLLQGMTLRQVAPELGLTVSTVSTYSKNIYKKLGINSRAELFLLFGRPQTAEARESGIRE
ncbi:MAG TPA: helix-turn-helix transcriptional regulator [Clostridiales bacterium]|nr:helix-turn-helix transcriptional regulator [Clostridiales bacterium]